MREEMKGEVRVFEEAIDIWRDMADRWREIADEAVRERGVFSVALSGGRTPLGFYCYLGREQGLPWERTELFQVDERFVPVEDDDSNFRMIELALLLKAEIPGTQVHAVPVGEHSAAAAARRYEEKMREVFRPAPGRVPTFDLLLLGVGADGHTASLFPGTAVLEERTRWAAAVDPPGAKHERITLTLPVINGARHVFFLVTGSGKEDALGKIQQGADPAVPASLVSPEGGSLTLYLDGEAAAGGAR
jgi:6-phosphogluconolactonase